MYFYHSWVGNELVKTDFKCCIHVSKSITFLLILFCVNL